MLLPDAKEIREQGMAEAHGRGTNSGRLRMTGLCSRGSGSRRRSKGTLKLYGIDGRGPNRTHGVAGEVGELRRGDDGARSKGAGRPPNAPPDSNLIELPVFADSSERGSELGWMIFELNENYVRGQLMPRLVAEYLNPGREAVYDVSVSWRDASGPA